MSKLSRPSVHTWITHHFFSIEPFSSHYPGWHGRRLWQWWTESQSGQANKQFAQYFLRLPCIFSCWVPFVCVSLCFLKYVLALLVNNDSWSERIDPFPIMQIIALFNCLSCHYFVREEKSRNKGTVKSMQPSEVFNRPFSRPHSRSNCTICNVPPFSCFLPRLAAAAASFSLSRDKDRFSFQRGFTSAGLLGRRRRFP